MEPNAINLEKVIKFELDGVVLTRQLVLIAMDRDTQISQASPVGCFIGNHAPGQAGTVNTPGGAVTVKVLAVTDVGAHRDAPKEETHAHPTTNRRCPQRASQGHISKRRRPVLQPVAAPG